MNQILNKRTIHTVLVIAVYSALLGGCTSRELYEAGQDLRCEEYYKHHDPYRKSACPDVSYEDYRKQKDDLKKNGS